MLRIVNVQKGRGSRQRPLVSCYCEGLWQSQRIHRRRRVSTGGNFANFPLSPAGLHLQRELLICKFHAGLPNYFFCAWHQFPLLSSISSFWLQTHLDCFSFQNFSWQNLGHRKWHLTRQVHSSHHLFLPGDSGPSPMGIATPLFAPDLPCVVTC